MINNYINSNKKKKEKILLIAHGTSSVGIASIVSILSKSNLLYIPHGGLSHFYHETNLLKKSFVYIFDIYLSIIGARFLFESRNTYFTYKSAYKKLPKLLKRKFLKQYIYSFTRKHIEKIDEFYSYSNINNNRQKNKKYLKITYMGTWREIKGVNRLVKVLKSFKYKDFNIEGLILNFEIYSDKNPNKIINFNPEFMYFKYWVDNPFNAIMDTDIVIIPSVWESFGYSAIDSILLNKPVIHTNQGGLSEIFEGSNMPVIPVNFDKYDLLNAIRYILKNSFQILMKDSIFLKNSKQQSWWDNNKYDQTINSKLFKF